ncbi:IS200/IS605 family element transposase accessory protein TnpB [Chroococcidiopsis sp. FACHB-1243]|uniref:IS200/IS605 family element RNA-guided endonuclease TnpB n=1 Tax=Chroococcidiopsis sp. [FACHB-1243] TaxID=2692781 RepID=UPI00178002CE|nr:IS200/IS605 family element RNA-guided endonuclease TnpB [Chroococcidiopsis sp. [FACHB-1243]]MBD2307237.1 IS200/IS605 family element transposase accessory protein TnpB [Chroococcidiopsis sp. [FACHB-1243]]
MGNKAYKFRLYPNDEQTSFLARCFGCSRFVYNHFLRLTTDVYAEAKKSLRYKDWAGLLVELKKQFEWLKEVNSQALQQTLKDLESAFVRFFKKQGGFPNFKKRSNCQSFRVPQHFSIDENGFLKLPKMTPIKMVIHKKIQGTPKNVTISKTPSGKYYASIIAEQDIPHAPLNGDQIGLDLGVKEFAITSKSEKFENPRYFQKSLRRLKIRQRRLSRKKKDSNNRVKARLVVAKVHEKVAFQRLDYQHKISLKLTCENQAISVEDLNIKGMVKNRKLAKQISDVAWGNFLTMLEYKGDIYGCEIKYVDRFFPSSKRCSNCGYIKEDLTLKIREWECPECRRFWDRDTNAALNLMLFSESKIPLEEGKSTPDQLVVRLGMSRSSGSGQEATGEAYA